MVVRVVKVGGSLFDLSDLPVRLTDWLAAQPPATTLLVAGGGPIADQVRQLDARFQLSPEATHNMAVWAMRIHGRILLELLHDARWLERICQLPADADRSLDNNPVHPVHPVHSADRADFDNTVHSVHALWILDPVPFIERDEPTMQPGPPLPCGWHVTSDSIAARVAQVSSAAELVLLKSRGPGRGLVDPYFSSLASTIRVVRSVNLRAGDWSRQEESG